MNGNGSTITISSTRIHFITANMHERCLLFVCGGKKKKNIVRRMRFDYIINIHRWVNSKYTALRLSSPSANFHGSDAWRTRKMYSTQWPMLFGSIANNAQNVLDKSNWTRCFIPWYTHTHSWIASISYCIDWRRYEREEEEKVCGLTTYRTKYCNTYPIQFRLLVALVLGIMFGIIRKKSHYTYGIVNIIGSVLFCPRAMTWITIHDFASFFFFF